MNKKLFTQIKNEWRSNTWLVVELLLVSVVMWFVVDYLFVNISKMLLPRGFDISHTYLVSYDELSPTNPDFVKKTDEETSNDVAELVNRIQHRPEVEFTSLSNNSYPYNGSNSSSQLTLAGDTLHTSGTVILRAVTPSFVRVFRYEGINGETPEQLAQILEHGELLMPDNLFRKYGRRMTEFVGRNFYISDEENPDSVGTKLGASIVPVRYGDFYSANMGSVVIPYQTAFDDNKYWVGLELCVRVKADRDKDFIQNLMADSERQLRVGNLYVSNVQSFADIRERFQRSSMNAMRGYYAGMGFLMLNIFLGLLGTFWFRTQRRRSEIALHKVHGATNGAVFGRLIGEGLLLLGLVTPPALLIDYNLAKLELNQWYNDSYNDPVRLLICAGIAFALISLMILIGVGLPAGKAMKVQPAEALHDE